MKKLIKNKQRYIEFAANEPNLPIFFQPWWLDVVCEKAGWEVALTGENHVSGALPYTVRKKSFFHGLGMPTANLFQGPYLIYPANQKYTSRIAFEHKTLTALLKQLPKQAFFEQILDEKITNLLAFKWLNYQQTSTYSYQLTSIDKHDEIFKNFKSTVRRDIRLAEKSIQIFENEAIDDLFETIQLSYAKHGMSMPFSRNLLHDIYETIMHQNAGKLFTAKDKTGIVHASALVIWDNQRAYCIFRGGNPQFLNSGAMSLLLWRAIQDSSNVVDIFDFGGSSVKSIEKFVQAFGGQQIHRHHIFKVNSLLFYLAQMGKDFVQFLKN